MICIRFIIIKMPISLSPVIFTALFSLILYSSIQELSAQEKWIDSDNSNESSEVIKTLTLEEMLALDTQELQSFVDTLSSSHIESYVKLLEWELSLSDDELDNLSDEQYEIFLSKSDILSSLKWSLKDRISEQKITEWNAELEEIADKKKKWNGRWSERAWP